MTTELQEGLLPATGAHAARGQVVFFRTDASIEIGSGHVMRCLALATKLKASGAQVSFICREPGNFGTVISAGGFAVHELPSNSAAVSKAHRTDGERLAHAAWLATDWETDAAQTGTVISAQCKGADWLVVDHYALDARWEAALRSLTGNLMVIDDLADRRHDCDVLLDQNLHRDLGNRYEQLLPSHCQRLLGPRYALLRPEFEVARSKLRHRDGTIRRLLIFFGGIDASNETAKALRAVQGVHRSDFEIDVILGAGSPHLEDIGAVCANLGRARLHHNPKNIAQLMGDADLAIGATGATTWERCCLGLPAIVISLAMNQESIAHAIAHDGLAVYLGKREAVTAGMITAALEDLMRDPSRVRAMSTACAKLTDGRGMTRVARVLDPYPIVLRTARSGDCESLHLWRNADETRRYSHSSAPIPLQQHRQWFSAVLQDPEQILLVGERDQQPVGVLRYDCQESDCTVSIYLVPGHSGSGYGPRLLRAGHQWLQRQRPRIKRVHARVLAANRASISAFLEAGYRRDADDYVKSLE